MRNYCVEALKAERKDVIRSMIFNCTIILGLQIVCSFFLIDALNEGDKLFKAIFLYSIMLIVTIYFQTYFIRNCILKWRDIENTKLVKMIRLQLPSHACDREIDYIFNILNIDLESTKNHIGPYYFGKDWLMSVPTRRGLIMAIKYTNIQKFHWDTISNNSDDSTTEGLIITCLHPNRDFTAGGINAHNLYSYLKETMPEKEFTRADAGKDLSTAYHAFKEIRKENNKKKGKF
ncbi:MAG: hypothetical protein RR627_10830 [Niameybacter sp.]